MTPLRPCFCGKEAMVVWKAHGSSKKFKVQCSGEYCWEGPWARSQAIALLRWNDR